MQDGVIPEGINTAALSHHCAKCVCMDVHFVSLAEVESIDDEHQNCLYVDVRTGKDGISQSVPEKIGALAEKLTSRLEVLLCLGRCGL